MSTKNMYPGHLSTPRTSLFPIPISKRKQRKVGAAQSGSRSKRANPWCWFKVKIVKRYLPCSRPVTRVRALVLLVCVINKQKRAVYIQ